MKVTRDFEDTGIMIEDDGCTLGIEPLGNGTINFAITTEDDYLSMDIPNYIINFIVTFLKDEGTNE